MGCIMTPMPNYLSTCLTTHLLMSGGGVEATLQNNKNHTKQCGKGSDVEQMRRIVRSVDMARMRRERKIDGLYRNATK